MNRKINKIVIVLVMITILSSGCLSSIHAGGEYIDALVEKKFVDVSKSQGSHYLLVTDKGMFEVDRPFIDTFNKSRNADVIYGKIVEGKKYRLHVYGYRIDWMYDYPIVVDATLIENSNGE